MVLGCDGGTAAGEAGIDTTDLFPVEDGSFSAFRNLTPAEYAESSTGDDLDANNLLFAMAGADGCDGEAWRVEFRSGAEWNAGAAVAAMHFNNAAGLSICAFENAAGTLEMYDPPVVLWADGTPLVEDEAVVSGSYSVSPRRADDVETYFGVFPHTAVFTIDGDGGIGGYQLQLAARYGLVVVANADFTADLVYTR